MSATHELLDGIRGVLARELGRREAEAAYQTGGFPAVEEARAALEWLAEVRARTRPGAGAS